MNQQDIDALVSRMVDEGKSDDEIRAAVAEAKAKAKRPSATELMHANMEAESPRFETRRGDIPAAARLMASGASYGAYGGWVDKEGMAKAREQMGPTAPIFELMGGVASGGAVRDLGKRALTRLRGPAASVVRGLTGNVATKTVAANAPTMEKVVTGAGNIVRQAGSGAAQGALYGFNATPGDRVSGAVSGAVGGGLVGGAVAAVPEIASALRGFKEMLTNRMSSFSETKAMESALDDLAVSAVKENLTPEQFAARAEEIIARPDALNADMFGQIGTGRILKGVANADDIPTAQSGSALKAAMTGRAERGPSVRETFSRLSGADAAEPPLVQREALSRAKAPATRAQYQAVEANFPDAVEIPEVDAIMRFPAPDGSGVHPVIQRAHNDAVDALRRTDGSFETPVFVEGLSANERAAQPVRNLRYYDEVKRALRRVAKKEPFARRAIADLDRALASAPGYAELQEARRLSSMEQKSGTASKLGERAATSGDPRAQRAELEIDMERNALLRPEDKAELRGTFSGGEARRLLALSDDQLAEKLGTPSGWEQIRQALPDEAAQDEFRRELQMRVWKRQQANLYGNAGQGNQAPVSFDALGALTPWDLASMLRGNPTLGLAHMAAAMEGKASKANVSRIDKQLLDFARRPASRGDAEEIVRRMRERGRPAAIPTRARTDRAMQLAGVALRSTRGNRDE